MRKVTDIERVLVARFIDLTEKVNNCKYQFDRTQRIIFELGWKEGEHIHYTKPSELFEKIDVYKANSPYFGEYTILLSAMLAYEKLTNCEN